MRLVHTSQIHNFQTFQYLSATFTFDECSQKLLKHVIIVNLLASVNEPQSSTDVRTCVCISYTTLKCGA